MAKAVSKHIPPITWVSLKDARERAAKALVSAGHAERWIVNELAVGHVRWRVEASYPPGEPLDGFWQGPPPAVNWTDSSATKTVLAAGTTEIALTALTAYFRLAWEDIAVRLPANSITATGPQPSPKAWLADAKQRYPRQPDEGVTTYAQRLAPLMEDDLGESAWPSKTIRRRLYDDK
jgi:hypothetical protein